MGFTVMAALAQMKLDIKPEVIGDSVSERRAAGKALAACRPVFTNSWIRNAVRLIRGSEPVAQVAKDLGISRGALYRRIQEMT